MAKGQEKKNRTGRKPAPLSKGAKKAQTTRKKAKPETMPAPLRRLIDRIAALDIQHRAGLALIAASLIVVASAGAWLGRDPLSGAAQWLGRGIVQSSYAALLALFFWIFLGRQRGLAYLLLLGITCSAVAIWDMAAGIYASRLRVEANNVLITFRDEPLNVTGLAESIERNPYVEAYMVMRGIHWDLHNRLDRRMNDYSAAYSSYIEDGQFLDVERLMSRDELRRAHNQVEDLEGRLARIEQDPLDTDDLLWTVNLLDVDRPTRDAYAGDLKEAISAAHASQAELLKVERQTLARIKRSLKVLIDAEGRYHFAQGRVVFDDPADAALFAGKSPGSDTTER